MVGSGKNNLNLNIFFKKKTKKLYLNCVKNLMFIVLVKTI